MVAVPSPLSIKVIPDGKLPLSPMAAVGLPVLVTVNVLPLPTLNVALFGLVISGETGPCATCNEKFWLLFGLTPLSAVITRS